jgi:hypothetical protein
MTTVATRTRNIADLEGFDIVIMQNGQPVSPKSNGGIGRYPYENKAKHSMTVAEWRTRFEREYPGYTCDVLLSDGNCATGQMKIRTVRETYEEE